MNRPYLLPYMALVVGVVGVSTSAILVKLATAPSAVIAGYRMLFSVFFILPILLLYPQRLRELKQVSTKAWLYMLIAGVFLAGHFVLWFESLRFTSIASSTVLVALQPLFALIGSYFVFRERLPAMAILGGITAVSGSVFIGWGDFLIGGQALFGDILALLAALVVTVYYMIGQYLRQTMSVTSYTFVVYGISSICLFLYVLLAGYSLFDYPPADWLWFVCLALFPTILGHSLFNWAIKWLGTSTVSMSILGEPVGTCILAYFILGETITYVQLLGGTVILAGIYLFIRYKTGAEKAVSKKEQVA